MAKSYIRVVCTRASKQAAQAVIARTWPDLARKIVIALLVIAVLYFGIEQVNPRDEAYDNQLVIAQAVLVATLIAAAGLFIINLLFVAPYQLWLEQKERADRAEAGVVASKAETRIVAATWAQIDPLQIYQAACLWVGKAPPDGPDVALPADASFWLHRLRDAVAKKRLPIYRDKDGLKYQMMYLATAQLHGVAMGKVIPRVPSDTELGRADLAAFAESIGERPAFLFGDEP